MTTINGYSVPDWAGGYGGSDTATYAETPYERPTWSDYWNTLKAGGHALASDYNGWRAQNETDSDWQKYYNDNSKYHKDVGQDLLDNLSPAAHTNANAAFLSGDWRAHPFSSTMLALDYQAPALAALGGAAALGATAGPVGAAAAGAGMMGLQSMASTTSAARDHILHQATEEELGPEYQSVRKYMSEDDARNYFATKKINEAHTEAKGFLIGAGSALVGEAGLTPIVSQYLGKIASGALSGAGMGVVQTPLTDLALGQISPDLQSKDLAGDTLRTAAGYGALGVLGGALAGRRAPARGEPVAGTSGTGVGSSKPRTDETKQRDISGSQEAQKPAGAAPPPAKADDAQLLALKAQQPKDVTLESNEKIKNERDQSTGQTGNVSTEPASAPPLTGKASPPRPSPEGQQAATPAPAIATPPPPAPSPAQAIPPVSSLSVPDSFPEKPETLALQQKALIEGKKELVIYPKGGGYSLSFLRDAEKHGVNWSRVRFSNGDIGVFRTDGPNELTSVKVRTAFNEGKLNELLQYGPVSKEEAVTRASNGESPIAVTERTPSGTEVKAAEGTEQTAPEQIKTFEAAKADTENTVQKETHAQVVADRLSTTGDAAGKRVTPRVLEDTSKPREPGYKPPGITKLTETPAKPKHYTKAEIETRADTNAKAEQVVANHPIKPEEAIAALEAKTAGERLKFIAKLKAMLDDAATQGVKLPGKIKDTLDERMGHSPAVAILREAKQLVKDNLQGNVPYQRFIRNLDMIASGPEGYRKYLESVREGQRERYPPNLSQKKIIEEPVEETAEEVERKTIAEKLKEQEVERQRNLEERRKESEELRKTAEEKPETKKPAVVTLKSRGKLDQIKKDVEARKEKFERVGSPTSKMLEAGNYDKILTRMEGHDISIETGKGEVREPFRTKSPTHYGYIKRTTGKDGDHIDVHIGPHGETGKIFVLNQRLDGIFDEHKVFMGFKNMDEVYKHYTNSYDNPKQAWRNVGGIVELNKEEFNNWLENGDKFQPISEGAGEGSLDKQVEIMKDDKDIVKVPYKLKTTVKDVLPTLNLKEVYSKDMLPVMRKLVDHIVKLVGDVPIYEFSAEHMDGAAGFYNSAMNHIALDGDYLDFHAISGNGDTTFTHIIIHEAFHAATMHALNTDGNIYELTRLLYHEIRSAVRSTYGSEVWVPSELRYGMTKPEEILTEIISNPTWHETLKHYSISPELAKELDMPKWRRGTLFQGVLDLFRKIFGLGPRDYSAIEAVLNIGERAMWAHDPGEEFGYVSRAAIRPDKSEGPLSAINSPTSYSRSMDELPGKIKSTLEDLTTRSGRDLKQTIFEKGLRFWPMMNMVHDNETKYGAADEHNALRIAGNLAQKMDAAKQAIRNTYRSTMETIKNYTRQNPNETETIHKLLQESDFFNVHPGFDLGEGPNRKIPANSKALEHEESLIHHTRLSAAYDNLSHQGQKTFNSMYEMLKSIRKDITKQTLENVTKAAREEFNNTIDRPDAAEYKTALDKTIKGESLDTEESKYYNDPSIKAIREATTILNRNDNGFYYPAKRQGKLVVTGNYDYDIGEGTRHPDDSNVIIFPTREGEFKFREQLKAKGTKEDVYLPSGVTKKYYYVDDNGKKEYVPAAEIRNIEGKDALPQEEYHVAVNNKHIEFMDSLNEGHKVADAMRDLGVKDVTNPVERRENQYLDYSLYGTQVDAFEKAIKRMQHVSPEARNAAIEAVNHVAVASMQGNRLNKSMLTKYRVAGASDDILRTMDQHLGAVSTFLANQKYRPDMDKALQRVKDIADSAQKSNNQHSYEMSRVAKEMETRVNGFRQGVYGEMGRGFLHNLAVMGLWKFLFSPAHFAMHVMHPVITSIPQMASEHGWGPTYRAMIKAYNDMGGLRTAGEGIKSSAQRLWDFDRLPTDFIASMKDRLRESGRDAATLRVIDQLEAEGYLTHNGLEFKPYYQKAGGITYWADRSLGIMQELNNSAENINRVGTAVAAFDLARRKGMNEEAALDYTRKTLSQTHGLYNNINRAPLMMSHPVVRSMLQFKTFPMMIYRILGRNLYNIIKGDDKEAKWQAFKALSGMVATAAVFTGAQGATPEPLRLAVTMGNLLGLNDSWEQQQDRITRTLASNFGSEIAGVIQHGLSHVLGWDMHHRLGIDDLMVFAEPHTTDPKDVENWISNAILGTPWGLGTDVYTGFNDLEKGNYGRAINSILPKALADLSKAYQLGTEGKQTAKGAVLLPTVGPMGLLGQALGFIPAAVSEAGQARAAYGADLADQRNEKERIVQTWRQGDKAGALEAMREYNKKYPTDRMTIPRIQSETLLGYPVTPKHRKELQGRADAYGIPQ